MCPVYLPSLFLNTLLLCNYHSICKRVVPLRANEETQMVFNELLQIMFITYNVNLKTALMSLYDVNYTCSNDYIITSIMNRTVTNTSLKTIPESPVSTCSNISSRQLESHLTLCVEEILHLYMYIYIYLRRVWGGVGGYCLNAEKSSTLILAFIHQFIKTYI